MKKLLVELALNRPKAVIAVILLLTVGLGLQLIRVNVDTDPENMLPEGEHVRVVHHEIKDTFGLNDFLVIGIEHDESVFTPEILARVQKITELVKQHEGVIAYDVMAPSEVDDVSRMDDGGLRVQTLMEEPPQSRDEAEYILSRIKENPVLRGKLASDDGKALSIFVPLKSKDEAKAVTDEVRALVAEDHGDERYHYAGLPVAEDSFGIEMFVQMGIAAPIAFFAIFLLMVFFFRKPKIVAAPMVVAMLSVTWTMGLLVGAGFTVHIMSSMIPVFLIPIAVLDAIHLLSEIEGHFKKTGDIRESVRAAMDELYTPMLFTTVTTIVGFGSLVLTPIPPVQVFGGFVAFGVFTAWILTMLFIPSYVILLSPESLRGFGGEQKDSPTSALHRFGKLALARRAPILTLAAVTMVIAGIGITKINVNDNPVYWFKPSHPLRVADRVMNEHLPGTYLAYLRLASEEESAFVEADAMKYVEQLQTHLMSLDNVGAVTTITDVVKKVQAELLGIELSKSEVPDDRQSIAQYLLLYEMSGGDPEDLYKLITPEQDEVVLWVQMPEGENRKVQAVVESANEWMEKNPGPHAMKAEWGGLSYINVVWQEKMVAGMGKALGSSFVVVLIMMSLLFRSFPLGLISMVPLTITIASTYGYIGWSGRDYDMPIAVLSSLALGLSVDFSIHFIQRFREAHRDYGGDVNAAMDAVFGLPSVALARNVVVIALGFVPMFFSNLMPYVTVGAFFFAIMILSGLSTFVLLPALLSLLPQSWVSRGAQAA